MTPEVRIVFCGLTIAVSILSIWFSTCNAKRSKETADYLLKKKVTMG